MGAKNISYKTTIRFRTQIPQEQFHSLLLLGRRGKIGDAIPDEQINIEPRDISPFVFDDEPEPHTFVARRIVDDSEMEDLDELTLWQATLFLKGGGAQQVKVLRHSVREIGRGPDAPDEEDAAQA